MKGVGIIESRYPTPVTSHFKCDDRLVRRAISLFDYGRRDNGMLKTTAGSHKGQFGMFMEKAPGLTCGSYVKSGDRQTGPGKLSMVSLRSSGRRTTSSVQSPRPP